MDLQELAFKYLVANEESIRQMFRNYAPEHEDELWSDVAVVRIHNIVMNFNPSLSSIKNHVNTNLRWYAFKWLQKNKGRRFQSIDATNLHENPKTSDLDVVDLVSKVLDELVKEKRELLVMKHMLFMTFEEISVLLSISRNTARTRYYEALLTAKELLKVRGLDNIADCLNG